MFESAWLTPIHRLRIGLLAPGSGTMASVGWAAGPNLGPLARMFLPSGNAQGVMGLAANCVFWFVNRVRHVEIHNKARLPKM